MSRSTLGEKGSDIQAVISNRLIASLKPADKAYEVRDVTVKGFMVRVQPTGKMSYAVQYARARKYTIGPVGVLTTAQARGRAKEVLADVVKGADPQAAKRAAKAHTFESYIMDVYAPWLQTHHADGAASLKRLTTHFIKPFGKQKLAAITAWNIEKWRSGRIKSGTAAATVNRDINLLKAALSRAVTWGFIKENPLVTVKPVKVDRTPMVRFLSDDEEGRLRQSLDAREATIRQDRASANKWRIERGYELLPELAGFADHLKPMVILSLNTGLRRGELFNLAWSDVDLERAMLTVRGDGAKSGQTRHVSLNDEALDVFKAWQSKSERVFPGKSGGRLTNVNNSWRKLLKDAEITKFRWHDLRHHFASRLVMAGVDLNTVRHLLGHADIKMTLRYAHLAPAVTAAAVQKLVRGESWQQKSQSPDEKFSIPSGG